MIFDFWRVNYWPYTWCSSGRYWLAVFIYANEYVFLERCNILLYPLRKQSFGPMGRRLQYKTSLDLKLDE